MSRRPNGEILPIKAAWERLMEQTEYRQLSIAEQAKQLGVADETIYRWRSNLPLEKWEEWLKKDNEELAPKILKVDDTLYIQALTGDVNAIKLWKESKQGWSPKQNLEISRGADKELSPEQMVLALKDALKMLPEGQRLELLKEAQEGAFLEAKSDPEKPSEIEMNMNGVIRPDGEAA